MEEEDVEVDQENAETNSAGGNVRIQIQFQNLYSMYTVESLSYGSTCMYFCNSVVLYQIERMQNHEYQTLIQSYINLT